MRHRGFAVLALVAALVFVIWVVAHVHDPRLGARETERRLAARVHLGERFECERSENDGSLSLADVDYVCLAADGWPRYAVATDDEGITDVEQFGGP